MKKGLSVLAGLMVFYTLAAGSGQTGIKCQINMRLYEIPMMQSYSYGGAEETGATVVGYTRGGNITASFPSGIVLIQTDFGKDATESKIKEELLARGYFKEAKSIFPSGFGWWPMGAFEFSCPQDELGLEKSRKEYHEKPVSSPKTNISEYWLIVRPKSADEINAVLGLKFECRLKTEKNPAGANRVLLDQDADPPLGKTLLIGFSSRDPAVGKTVYILTVFAQKAGS